MPASQRPPPPGLVARGEWRVANGAFDGGWRVASGEWRVGGATGRCAKSRPHGLTAVSSTPTATRGPTWSAPQSLRPWASPRATFAKRNLPPRRRPPERRSAKGGPAERRNSRSDKNVTRCDGVSRGFLMFHLQFLFFCIQFLCFGRRKAPVGRPRGPSAGPRAASASGSGARRPFRRPRRVRETCPLTQKRLPCHPGRRQRPRRCPSAAR